MDIAVDTFKNNSRLEIGTILDSLLILVKNINLQIGKDVWPDLRGGLQDSWHLRRSIQELLYLLCPVRKSQNIV